MEAREFEKCIDVFGTDIYRFYMKLCLNKTDAENLYQTHTSFTLHYRRDYQPGTHAYHNTYLDGIWKLDFKSASDSFVSQEDFAIENADTELLYADISCGVVPEGASLTLWLVQGDNSQFVDVTNLSGPLEYSLNKFENGTLHVRLQINGVEDTVSEIYIK